MIRPAFVSVLLISLVSCSRQEQEPRTVLPQLELPREAAWVEVAKDDEKDSISPKFSFTAISGSKWRFEVHAPEMEKSLIAIYDGRECFSNLPRELTEKEKLKMSPTPVIQSILNVINSNTYDALEVVEVGGMSCYRLYCPGTKRTANIYLSKDGLSLTAYTQESAQGVLTMVFFEISPGPISNLFGSDTENSRLIDRQLIEQLTYEDLLGKRPEKRGLPLEITSRGKNP